ncbi:MAG: SidA/IucD/PvdA family monooxygenase [Alphaproteobacteria bacterium]|nr:SidA/IucD/PvdA family monooxygenase [Alphaproteobacteria bacterium]
MPHQSVPAPDPSPRPGTPDDLRGRPLSPAGGCGEIRARRYRPLERRGVSTVDENVLVIGAGQGGLSASYFLTRAGVSHRIVDRGGVAHAWERHRWDSFCLVTPNWTVNLPGRPYDGDDPDGFMLRDDFVAYMKDWAGSFDAPVTAGVEAKQIARTGRQFRVSTNKGDISARAVIVATATHQHPRLPPAASSVPANLVQLHAEDYRNPGQAAPGAVLVVGSGQTGCQIVEDFLRAGRDSYLCVARTGRLPRRYRGRDIIFWQHQMGLLDRTPGMLDDPGMRFVGDPHVTGRDGGGTVSLYDFARRGVRLLGRLEGVDGRSLHLRNDLADNLDYADRFCADVVAGIDEFVEANGIDAPPHSEADGLGYRAPGQARPETPACLNLDEAGIGTVIWATGFGFDFSWIEGLPTDRFGYPVTDGGASPMEGMFFSGLNWMTKRKSGILYGVGEDGRLVANHVAGFLEGRPGKPGPGMQE